jgi:subtilisin family serine protease
MGRLLGKMAAGLLALAALNAYAGSKVEICHYPPDNPENAQTLMIDADSLDDHLTHGDTEGPCPPSASEIDPPTVRYNPDLFPPTDFIEGVDGGPPRKLARMHSDVGQGYEFDYVEDEVYLISDDPADLADFQSRWPATVLSETPFPSLDPGADPTVMYLLHVDPSSANTKRLDKDLEGLDPRLYGDHQVSSEAALQLLEVVASEIGRHGLKVGINVLLQSQGWEDFDERSSEEAMVAPDQGNPSFSFIYTRNGFDWPYMRHDPDFEVLEPWAQDTGVPEAFRVMRADGVLSNRVRVMIADGGFWPNADFPPYYLYGEPRTVNPDPTGCGRGHPPRLDVDNERDCATHGTHVTLSGFGYPDNRFGTFGPGGPVSDLLLLQSPSLDVGTIGNFIVNTLPEALDLRPKIINVSASVAIPGGWCFIACEPINLLSGWLNGRGIIFVAAAGNERTDVDRIDEFCVGGLCTTFEEAAHVPCETDYVMCVGADTFFQGVQTTYSNYGTASGPNSVDIFAPGDMYSVDAVDADTDLEMPVDDLHIIHGTSFASPFTAGVVALTWAANPALTNSQVRDCVLGSARTGYPTPRPHINALGAVSCAMGGSAPWVKMVSPVSGTEFIRGTETVELKADTDDYEQGRNLPIHWTSSLDGDLGTTSSGEILNLGAFGLSVGEHEICARVTDNTSRSWQDCSEVTAANALPIVEILQPEYGDTFSQSSTIVLNASAYDPSGSTLSEAAWFVEPRSTGVQAQVATGLSTSIEASSLEVGSYWLILKVLYASGSHGYAEIPIYIVENPANSNPVITINEPVPGSTIEYDPLPGDDFITVRLDASAFDEEDGAIPFDQITWTISKEGQTPVPLTVNTSTYCLVFDTLGHCARLQTIHSFQISPAGSNVETQFDIKGHVTDSNGNSNETANGRVTFFLHQVI